LAYAPYHDHHLLIIPKRHVQTIHDLTNEEVLEIFALHKVAFDLMDKLKYTNYSMLVRYGADSGRSVQHLHYHVIPNIRLGDLDHDGNTRRVLSDEEIKRFKEEILKLLPEAPCLPELSKKYHVSQ
jgi:diadenosine tetraphosphate (Ap4A) HIT family hydrolase